MKLRICQSYIWRYFDRIPRKNFGRDRIRDGRYVKSLRKLSCMDCMVMRIMPAEKVFIELIAPIGVECGVTTLLKRLTVCSEIKFAVAHVSNNARHLMKLYSLSRMYTVALVINCGMIWDTATRLLTLSLTLTSSHTELLSSAFAVPALLECAYPSRCNSVLCRFWQIIQLEKLQGRSRCERKQL